MDPLTEALGLALQMQESHPPTHGEYKVACALIATAAALEDADKRLSETTYAERCLRRLAEVISMAEGETEGFGDETAADHELSAIHSIFHERRKAGDDPYKALCAALEIPK